MEVPVIDLELPDRARLESAARDVGAFLLTGHGVPAAQSEELLAQSRAFFALPQAQREAIDMIHSPYFRGYSAAGSERTQGRPDLREQFDVGPEETPQALTISDPAFARLRGPNLWPPQLPALRPALLAWMERLRGVSTRLMAAASEIAGLPADALAPGFTGQPHERLKIIKYPAGDGGQGVGEHSDSGFLALIVQDGTAGLEVHDGNRYVDVLPAPGQLVAVFGRAMAEATDGKITAARHRVTSPAGGRERISVAYFLNPRLDYAGYGEEALRVVLRSHPETAQRYFADLV